MAVLQVAAQYAPVVVDIDIPVLLDVQLPAAQFFKGAAGTQGSQRPRDGTGPAGFVHQHRAHNTGGIQPPAKRFGGGHGGGKHHGMGLSFRAAGPQQVYEHLVGRVADIQIGLHTSASSSLTGGKWMRPQPEAHSGMVRSLLVTSKANSVTGLSRQTAWRSAPSKISR